MIYELPTSIEVGNVEYAIRSDYRPVLDICIALGDPELSDYEKAVVALEIFYIDEIPVEHQQEALDKCFWFINCGEEMETKKSPKLMDWEQDFKLIVNPINRVIGKEIRSLDYLHWWTFISAYYEIGDCLFAQVVSVRDKRARGKPLDKTEKEFYRKNRNLIDIKTKYTQAEEEILNTWA